MPDMKSAGRALACTLVLAAATTLSGCKSLTLSGEKTAAAASEQQDIASAPAKNGKHAPQPQAEAYTDPQVAVSAPMDGQMPQTLPGSEEPAENIAGLVNQPTGIKAGQTSIFSSGAPVESTPIPTGENGAMLSASAYRPTPGVNARLYSVYGQGTMPTGASSPLPE